MLAPTASLIQSATKKDRDTKRGEEPKKGITVDHKTGFHLHLNLKV